MYATGNSIGQLYGLMAEGLYQKEDFDAQEICFPDCRFLRMSPNFDREM